MTYTIIQYAARIGKSRYTVYSWIRKNTLPKGVRLKIIAGKKFIEEK